MKVYRKNIRTLFVMLLFSSVGISQTVAAENGEQQSSDTLNRKAVGSARQKKEWQQIYRENATLFFDRALMGREAGVYTSVNGFVGNSGIMMIRGINTLNLDASPYIMVEGVPVRQNRMLNPFVSGLSQNNIGFISPLDVADIEVVKGGYNGSFYGGRSGNGVINVSVDKGVLGSTAIDVMARVGFTQADYSYDVLNTTNYRGYLYDYMQLMGKTLVELDNNLLFDPTHAKYNHNTNWLDEFKQNGFFHDYQFKMKGGDGDTRYMFSLGYASEDETLQESNYQRFNMRFNLDYKITPKISISNYLAYSYGTARFFGEGTDWAVNPIYLAATKAPFMSRNQYDDNGTRIERLADLDVLGKSNPAVFKDNLENRSNENRIDGIIKANWQIDQSMALATYFSVSYNSVIEQMHRLSYGLAPDENRKRQNSKRNYGDYMLRWDTYFTREGEINNNFGYMGKAGFIIEQEAEKMVYGRRVNAATDDFETLNNGEQDSIGNMNYTHNLMTFYVNGKLNYRNVATLAGNVYLEASSNFGNKGRWTVYGGLDLGVNVLQTEQHDLAIYAQWGRTGNNDIRGSYQHTLYSPTKYMGYGGVYLGNVKNENLKPEITNNYDFGFNTRLLDHVLEVSAGYYYKKTTGLLTRKSVAIEVGLDPQFENNGNVLNQGVEVAVNANILKVGKVKWSVFANLSTVKNEVKDLNNGDIIRSLDKFTGIAREGEELGSFYGYKVKGVFKTAADVNGLKRADGTLYLAGDYQMEDLNHDDMINELDMQVIGSPIPDFYGGFGTNLAYKGFTFGALFSYSYGNDVYNLFRQKLNSMSDISNQSVEVMGRWISENQSGKGELPRAAYGDPSGNFNTSDKWVEDGSYLRLKSLSVSYDVPMKKRTGFVKGINLFANCNNLFTISGYSGFDPEVFSSVDPLLRGVDTGASATPKSYIFGLKIAL